mgnify:CR=1 FL=1
MKVISSGHFEPGDKIECVTGRTVDQPNGYPVLWIGSISLFPSVRQLAQIRIAVDRWLDTNRDLYSQPLEDSNGR